MSQIEPTEAEISDLIDGRLSGRRREEVERWLADHPERARAVERQRELNSALKDLGSEILDEPVPERLRDVLKRTSDQEEVAPASDGRSEENNNGRPKPRRWFGGPIGAIALVLVGVAIGWIAHSAAEQRESPFDALLADASYAFSFYSQDRNHAIQFPPDRVADFAAVSDKLFARKVDPPDLQSAGLKFRGARIAPIGRKTSSFFFFEDQEGEILTVVFWPESEQDLSTPGFRDLGEISAQFWFSQGFAFAVIGEADQQSLSEIGDKVVSFYGHDLGS